MFRLFIILFILLSVGCTTLPPRDEFVGLACKDQTALLYDYAKENRRLAVGSTILGVAGIATGVGGILAAKRVGDGVKAMAAGAP